MLQNIEWLMSSSPVRPVWRVRVDRSMLEVPCAAVWMGNSAVPPGKASVAVSGNALYAASGKGPFLRPGEDLSAAQLLYRIIHEEPVLDGVCRAVPARIRGAEIERALCADGNPPAHLIVATTLPLLMLASIIMTANHYVLDAVIGGAVGGIVTGWPFQSRRSMLTAASETSSDWNMLPVTCAAYGSSS